MYLQFDTIDPKKIYHFKKTIGPITKQFWGYQINNTHYYPYVDLNFFSDELKKIPPGYKKSRKSQKHFKKCIFNKDKKILEKDNQIYKDISKDNEGATTYRTHDNGGRPFLVYVNNDLTVNVYSKPVDEYCFYPDYYNLPDNYINLVDSYVKPVKVFVGTSPYNRMTSFSGGHGTHFDGNSILVYLGNFEYVFIGDCIYKFKTTDDIIETYYSPVGNSDVPYPFAISNKNVYFMLDKTYVARTIYDKVVPKDETDGYSYYYGQSNNVALSKSSVPMNEFVEIFARYFG